MTPHVRKETVVAGVLTLAGLVLPPRGEGQERQPPEAEPVNVLSSFTSDGECDGALLDVVKAADPDVTIDAADLEALELPFSVENTTFGRSVEVLVTSHQDSVLIGQSQDSLRVEVPDGIWVPGDVMYFVETVTRNVLDANGNVTLDASGQPVAETVPAATFKAALGCLTPRVSCDPTVGGAQVSGYVGFQPGYTQEAQYDVPLESGDEMVVGVQPAVSAQDAAASGQVSLDGVHVVPNPYIFANEFERTSRGGGAQVHEPAAGGPDPDLRRGPAASSSRPSTRPQFVIIR